MRCATSEPEATLLRQKHGGYSVSYRASTTVNAHQFIVGTFVSPSSETEAIPPMLRQHAVRTNSTAPTFQMGSSYFTCDMLNYCMNHDVNVICPDRPKKRNRKSSKFEQRDFIYDENIDAYWCPAKALLTLNQIGQSHGRNFVEYKGDAETCLQCAFRSKCTNAQRGRTLERSETEVLREVMREVMKHPSAKALYRKRHAIVEPVYGLLRTQMKFNRFKRRGLANLRMAWSLVCSAYNLRKAIKQGLKTLLKQVKKLFYWLTTRNHKQVLMLEASM